MAQFCAFYAWCTPERFWDLELDEYLALAAVIDTATTRSKGG
jgi:hypothetical protein